MTGTHTFYSSENNGIVAIYSAEAVKRYYDGDGPVKCLVFASPDHPNISLFTGDLEMMERLVGSHDVFDLGHNLFVPLSAFSLAEGDDGAAALIREANMYVGSLADTMEVFDLTVPEPASM